MHAHLFWQIRGLQTNANSIFELLPLLVGVEAQDSDLPSGARPQPLENLDGRGFSGAVRAKQAKDFSRLDFEVDSLHRVDIAIGLGQSPDGDGWRSGTHGGLSGYLRTGGKSKTVVIREWIDRCIGTEGAQFEIDTSFLFWFISGTIGQVTAASCHCQYDPVE